MVQETFSFLTFILCKRDWLLRLGFRANASNKAISQNAKPLLHKRKKGRKVRRELGRPRRPGDQEKGRRGKGEQRRRGGDEKV